MTNDATMTATTEMTMTTTPESTPRAWRWARSTGAVLGGMAASAAAIGFVASLAGVVATFTHDMGPLRYPVALAVTTLPCAWLGGALRARKA